MPIQRKPNDPPLPEIAGYKVLRVLGQGGMSNVFLAQQLSLGREVAIKVMLPGALADEISRRRFENEARTIARLDHPHIVKIHEVGRTSQGQPYYVMPVLRRGHVGKRHLALDESKVRSILQTILSALGYAHSRGVIHRDVKAENVLFDEADRAMLTDFGIALRRGYGSRVTTDGVAVGSTAYMAPEQARGEEVDLRADLYSLAVLGWEMLAGSLPYQANDALSMALKHVQDPIPRLPAELAHWQRFFDRAMAKAPIDRFPDAKSMLDAMNQVPHAQRQPMRAALARISSKFTPVQWWLAAGSVAAIAIAGATLMPASQRRNLMQSASSLSASAAASVSKDIGIDPTRGAPEPDPTGALLRAAPESAAQAYVSAAEQQLQQRRLISPSVNNAYDNLMIAWRTDPSHPGLAPLSTRLVDQLCSESLRQVRDGADDNGKQFLERAERLSQRNDNRDAPRLTQLRKDLGAALSTRMGLAQEKADRRAAKTILASAKAFDLPQAQIAGLQAKSVKVGLPGDRIAGASGEMTLTSADGKTLAISRAAVSRDSYADFAKSTQRPAALCRERVSLLRVLAPRTWEEPGFEQAGNNAVVCVSWQDAEAYARWQSQRSRYRYRLPTAAEAQAIAKAQSGKAVAEWVSDCGSGGCGRRLTNGKGWRPTTVSGARALDASRGYDDVGFRLVREL